MSDIVKIDINNYKNIKNIIFDNNYNISTFLMICNYDDKLVFGNKIVKNLVEK